MQKYADIQPRTYWWEFPYYTVIRSARQKFCLGERPEDLDQIGRILTGLLLFTKQRGPQIIFLLFCENFEN
jgi:hypothetical protein